MKPFYLAFFFFTASVAFAQSDSTIFGLHRDAMTQDLSLSSMEPSTGVVTMISNNPIGNLYAANALATVDPFERIYYCASLDSLVGIDLQTGEVVSKVAFDFSGNDLMDFMQFNVADSLLYGLTRTPSLDPLSTTFVLSTIDPLTGQLTGLSQTPIQAMFSVFGMAAIDPIEMKVYLVTADFHILGIDLVTGEEVSSAALGLPSGTHLDFLRYNYEDYTLYAVRRHPNPHAHYLCTVDPATGDVTPLSETSFWDGFPLIGNALGTIDPNNGIFYVSSHFSAGGGGKTLVGVDLVTGETVVEVAVDAVDAGHFDMGVYFPDICPRERLMALSTAAEAVPAAFDLYPNPAVGQVILALPEAVMQGAYRIMDLLGVQVAAGQLRDSRTSIDVSSLPKGMYLVSVASENTQGTRRLIVH